MALLTRCRLKHTDIVDYEDPRMRAAARSMIVELDPDDDDDT
jgi:hypothetical protein